MTPCTVPRGGGGEGRERVTGRRLRHGALQLMTRCTTHTVTNLALVELSSPTVVGISGLQ